MRLLDYRFVHAATIEPERGSNDAPQEWLYPSGQDPHGKGPFCRFKLEGLPQAPGVYAVSVDG